ncbi:sensor histidine kinase [Halosegnis sp.]|uniref:sensor histidine kinase n=1 Tax=Halosegnis sp. TaxID=2864959 RepID=UPI0035D46183
MRIETTLTTAAVDALAEFPLAIVELLENAVRHSTAASPTVTVSVTLDDETASLLVTDEASPIPDAEATVLTGGVDMTDVYHSTGLGLWLVYWLVELSGGRVDVTRTDGGNQVEVILPLATD